MLAAVPAVVSIVVGALILYSFRDVLKLGCGQRVGGTLLFMVLLVGAFLVPSYATMAGEEPVLAVQLLPLGSFAVVVVAAAIERYGGHDAYQQMRT